MKVARQSRAVLRVAVLGLALGAMSAPRAGESQACPFDAGQAAAWLPPPALATDALSRLPELRAAQAEAATAQARRRRLELGPHEWSARADFSQRREQMGGRYAEHEFGLETAVRWPAKVAADRELGAQEAGIGELALAEAWRQAGRRLLDDWFGLMREARVAGLLEDQAGLAARQLALTERRVQAGEVAPLDRLLAEAERARAEAAAAQARLRTRVALRTLQTRYAGLPAPALDGWMQRTTAIEHQPDEPVATRWSEACAASILVSHPELELVQARARQALLKAQRAELERSGDPTLGLRVARERGGQENVLGVYAALPLGGEARRAAVLEAQGEAQVAQERLAETRQRVELEAAQTVAAYPAALSIWRQLETARERAERGAQLQARAYELGEGSLPDLLLARRGAIDATLAAEAAAVDALQSLARLRLDSQQLWNLPRR